MKLEDQVVSLEIAKRLKELGMRQESFFQWEVSFGRGSLIYKNLCNCRHFETKEVKGYFSAFTVAELGELTKNFIHKSWYNGIWHCSCLTEKVVDANNTYEEEKFFIANTEADARGKMRIWLLKEGKK